MLSTEPRQMSPIEQFSLGSIILWQFTPFLMSAVINGELHLNKKFKKKTWKKKFPPLSHVRDYIVDVHLSPITDSKKLHAPLHSKST